MAKRAKGLTAKEIRTIGPGTHGLGDNLYLEVQGNSRSWVFRYVAAVGDHRGKRRDMGLGSIADVSHDAAKEAAADARKLIRSGVDPIEARRAQAAAAALPAAPVGPTFKECAETYIATRLPGWRNSKHGAQWPSTLARYVYPVFGSLPVSEVTTSHVLEALQPIWNEKNETASRIRGRIERILDSAKVKGYRSGDNPARWDGNLQMILPARSSVATVKHHRSIPYQDAPAFWLRLQMHDGMAARCLELGILCASRPEEALGALWSEYDLAVAVRRIPAERMKARMEHRIPLTPPALVLLRKLDAIRCSEWVFPGHVPGQPLSEMSMNMVLRRMEVDATPHGFRATFKTWATETTPFADEVSEAALSHTKGKLTAAYQRGDLFEKRRGLMLAWADYLGA